MSYQEADVAPYNLGGNYGTGGSATLAACTATCFTWACSDTGCTSTVGYNINAYQHYDEILCNQNCTSHDCTDTGCIQHLPGGSGGTYAGMTSMADCQASCMSWECRELTGVNGGITLSNNFVNVYTNFTIWNQDSCTAQPGTGSTFSSLADCHTGTTEVSACTSWSCQYPGSLIGSYYEYPDGTTTNYAPNGCLQFANTGNTYSQLTYDACTAQTVCNRYDCTDNGCVIGDHVTGTYPSFSACTGGTIAVGATPALPACQSWECTESDGCETYNAPGASAQNYIDGTYGTGGTNTTSLIDCDSECVSYNCTNTGCSEQSGYGGTYYDISSPSNALSMCQEDCYSFNCIDDGCEIYNSPGSESEINGLSGTGGTYAFEIDCDPVCISWNCTDNGCESQVGTGGTFTTKALCTGSCQSWACSTTGCTGYNDPLYPNSPGYSDGEYGTGGTITESGCTATCQSWNCTDTGCIVSAGTQNMYSDLSTCNTECSSWDCISSGCTEYNISAGTPSYSSGSGGTGGTYFNSSCDNECSSWDCTSTGCTEYNVNAGTASYNLFAGSVYQGFGGSGGTYTSDTCNNICHSYECLEVETNPGWTWQDDGCVIQSGTGSTFYSGIVSLAGVVASYTACTGECRSWSCENPGAASVGCLEYPNTGTTNTFSSLTACTADTSCVRYDCTDYGCVVGDHITGTYGGPNAYGDCELACTSWTCEDDGCKIYNDISTGTFFQNPGGGTGGTFTTSNCDDICQSYNCVPTWSGAWSEYDACTLQVPAGSGGTFFNPAGVSYSLQDCQTGTTTLSACSSWSCENPLAILNGSIPLGCRNYPNTGNTTTQIMFDSYTACTAQTVCERYDCTPNGCVIGSQVTGQYDTFEECTGGTVANNNTDACQSWSCTETGTTTGVPCEVFNGPNSVGVTSTGALNYVPGLMYPSGPRGTYGTGGVNQTSLANCNINCESWNCEDTGCNQQIGYGGAYDNNTCSTIGGVQNICFSYECDSFNGQWELDGCVQFPGSGSTFFSPAGTQFSLDDCHSACTSWSCQNPGPVPSLGCLEYPNTGNTLSQPTYTACTAETVCWRYECTDNGCVPGDQVTGTYDSLDDCLTGTTTLSACESWQCTDDGCEEWNSLSYPLAWHYTDGTQGTGGTNTISLIDCNRNCRSYSCEDYGCEQHGGTGHTYISTVYANEQSVWSLCIDNCKSWDCIDVGANWQNGIGCQIYNQLIPPNSWVEGGSNGFGTGGTYTAATCASACTSWRCQDMGTFGCTEFPNTASTYSSYTSCTANTECKSYDCTVSGCVERNYQYMGGIDSYSAMSSCTENCVGWACTRDTISTGSSIYVYYDISNLSFGNILNKRNDLRQYINSNHPLFAGNVYHTIVSDGRWLDWANSIYSGEFSVAPGTGALPLQPTSYYDERALLGIRETSLLPVGGALSDDWYDQYSAGTYSNIGISSVALPGGNIPSLTTHGPAPTANTSNNVVVISFITEADGVESPQGSVISNVHGYHDSTIPTPNTGYPIMVNQPMTEWKQDYTAYTENYNTVSGASGSIRALLYPVRIAGNDTVFNPQSTKMCLLQSFAAISSGNQTVSDGTWSFGTAPTTTGLGGIVGSVPELCWTSLNQLESQNPYWTNTVPTWGGLDMSGWTVNVEGTYLGSTDYTGFLNDYLISTSTGSTAGTCTSAETLYTASIAYPLSSETECDIDCVPEYYLCTDTGCTLSWTGYLTLAQCTNKCKSVSCTTVGCEYYNSPGSLSEINGYYGSGGTFTGGMGSGMMFNCYEVCTSTNCNGYPNNLSQQGCIQQTGTGGTWTGINQYSACTGTCVSWTCDDPCQYLTPPYTLSSGGDGCMVWPNTGATHIELTACTATCQENYYCITGLTADTCSEMVDTTIISPDIIDHIDAIAISTAPDWTNDQFSSLKFILTNVVTPPTNGCYDVTNNGYWTYVTMIHVHLDPGGVIPTDFYFLDWDDLINTMNGTATIPAVLITPMTEISDIMNVPGITVTINSEFCECTTSDCNIGCTNTSSLPSNATGFYPTYFSAQTTCCPLTSWSCVTNTTIDNCDGLTLLPGIFANPEACYNYMSITPGFSAFDFTNVKCEITPTSVLNTCEIGPNNGELVKLTGITTTGIAAISSNVYTSWTGFTAALQGLSPTVGVFTGLPSIIYWILTNNTYPGVEFTYGWFDCECDNPYTCECVEIAGSGGTYTSQTLCEEACCSATTWNCVQGQSYLPICQDKQDIGYVSGGLDTVNYFKYNAPSTLFGLFKFTIDGPISPLFSAWTTSQVNAAMAGSGNGDYCFRYMGNGIWHPWWYIYSVSHQLINGGMEYQTWDDFYNATDLIVTACTTSDSVFTIKDKINSHFSISAFTIDVDWKLCCSPDDCYCYDTLTTNGDYNSEILCDAACCPPEDELSWICTATTGGISTCQFGYHGAPSLDSINDVAGYGPWSSYQQCSQRSLVCATSWYCSVPSGPPPCFGEPCIEQAGHYSQQPNLYPTKYSCETNTNLDCCGPEYLWVCVSAETTTTMSGLTTIPDNAGTLGYHTSDEVLTYLSDPTASPTRQYSDITGFTLCKFETDPVVLNAAEESCKCGDGCDGILHSSNYIVFNNLVSGSGSNSLPYHPATNPDGYCTNWADMITQLNTYWDPTGTLNVTLNDTFNHVVTATTNVIGSLITISIQGLESCVDTTGYCGCEPCYTPNCGSSKLDCENTCCPPIPTTWTCTSNGCLDVCNGKGEFSSATECKEVCYEWGCMDDVWGCTDSGATNYNPLATIDDGTCVYPTDRWSCRNNSVVDGCASRTAVPGGLSYTAAIYGIAANHHDVEFSTLKYDLGGGNNQMQSNEDIIHRLPTEPCQVPCSPPSQDCVDGFATWGQPGPYFAYIKYVMYSGLPGLQFTTWKSFIDAINTLGYTFPYNNTPYLFGWQDLEAVLGSTQLHCEWTWCDCGDGCNCVPDANGIYLSELQCDSDTSNCCESWNCETTYDTNTCSGMTDIGFVGTVLWPNEPLEFMVNNGYQYTDVSTLKWIFNNPAPTSICTINNNTQHWAYYPDLTVGDSSLSIPNASVQTWDAAITWLNTNSGLSLTPTMPYSIVMNILSNSTAYIEENLGNCYCTGIDCGCIEVFDGSGQFKTSGECLTNATSCCYAPPESWNCSANYVDSCASKIDAGVGSFFVSTQLYFDFINVNFGANADIGDYKNYGPCPPNAACPVANQAGMCYGYRNYWQTSYFGNPANLIGGVESPDFNTFQEIVDWFNLVATTEGYAGGFNTSMTIDDMMTLAVSQNTYTAQDYCNAGPTTPWGCTNQVPPAMGSGGGGGTCGCSPNAPSILCPGDCIDKTLVPPSSLNVPAGTMNQFQSVMWICDPINGIPPTTLFEDFYFTSTALHSNTSSSYPDACESIQTPGYSYEVPISQTFYYCPNDSVWESTNMPFSFVSKQDWVDQLVALGLAASTSMDWFQLKALLFPICGVTNQIGSKTICQTTGTTGNYCYDPGDGSGQYSTQNACMAICSPDPCPNGSCNCVTGLNPHVTTPMIFGGQSTNMGLTDDSMAWYIANPTEVMGSVYFEIPGAPVQTQCCGVVNGCTHHLVYFVKIRAGGSGGPYAWLDWTLGSTWTTFINDIVSILGINVNLSMTWQEVKDELYLVNNNYQGWQTACGCELSTACDPSNCVGTVNISDNNFENFLETHSGTTTTATYGSNNAVATWPNTMGNGVIGDNHVELSGICCVTQLNVENQFISSLYGIHAFNELMWLNAKSNQLTILDVSSNVKLETLHVPNNNLTTIDISTLPLLGWLSCQNNELTTVDTSNNPNLYQFLCYQQQNWGTGGGITSLDLSQNPLMKYLQCQVNQLTNLDVSMLPLLWTLRCGSNQLTTLDVTNNLIYE